MNRTGYVTFFSFMKMVWALVFVGSVIVSALVMFAPLTVIQLVHLSSAEMTETATRILGLLRLPVWLVPITSLGAFAYFRGAEKQARVASLLAASGTMPAEPVAAGRRWNILLLALAAACLIFWIIPIQDGLQDDEGDKLRVALWGWDYWFENVFNTRVNILPITMARLVYLVTHSRVEWVLRLPLLLVFGLPLLYMFTVSFRKRYSPQVSVLLLIFFALSGIAGEYASKVQGYLAALTFSTACFILWIDIVRDHRQERILLRGAAFALCCLGAYLSHNFTVFFLLGLFDTTVLIAIVNRFRQRAEMAVTAIIGFMWLAFLAIALISLLSFRSILAHLGGGGDRGLPAFETLYKAIASAMTGTSHPISLVLMFGYFTAWFIALHLGGRRYRPELTLAALLTFGLVLYFWIFNPRFFIDRFMIWLPLVWLPILGEGGQLFLEWLPSLSIRVKGLSCALGGVLFALLLIPSQISWQQARATAVNLRVAAEAGKKLGESYEAQGYSVAYLLLRSYGNYSHRMWFYFPEDRTVSDHNSEATLKELHNTLDSQVWIVPVPRNELSGQYNVIPDIAVERQEAGNATLYVVFEAALDAVDKAD